MHNPKGRSAFWIYRAIGLGHSPAVPLNDFEGSLVGCRPQPWTGVARHCCFCFNREPHGLHTSDTPVPREDIGFSTHPGKDLTLRTLQLF